MCKKATSPVCPQEPEPAPGKKFSEPEPAQNRPAPNPCVLFGNYLFIFKKFNQYLAVWIRI